MFGDALPQYRCLFNYISSRHQRGADRIPALLDFRSLANIRYKAFGVTIPLIVSYLIGKIRNFLELGAGSTIVSGANKKH